MEDIQTYHQLRSATGAADQFFSQSDMNKIEADIRAQLAKGGINLDDTSDLFPATGDAAPTAGDRHAVGETESVAKRNTPCIEGTDASGYVPLGVDPMVTKFMDLSRLYSGLHETAHVVNGNLNPDKEQYATLADKKFSENVADVTAAIYMLNKYPDNLRITEFMRLYALERRAGANGDGGGGDSHDSSLFIEKLLENPANWRIDDGKNTDIFAATKKAVNFVETNQPLLLQKSPMGSEAARDKLCLSSQP
jgi:hypothetical protein